MGHCEAAKVLLDTPELVEKPLPFIDLETTFDLIRRGLHYSRKQESHDHERFFND